jgi:hypothetical protein
LIFLFLGGEYAHDSDNQIDVLAGDAEALRARADSYINQNSIIPFQLLAGSLPLPSSVLLPLPTAERSEPYAWHVK